MTMTTNRRLDLGINIDHVATLRQARGTRYPDPLYAALLAEQAGADSITLHLREDRRHIQDRDLDAIKEAMQTRMNLEMAVTEEMLKIAGRVKPEDCCLVPEKREELTTEGGLDVRLKKTGFAMPASAWQSREYACRCLSIPIRASWMRQWMLVPRWLNCIPVRTAIPAAQSNMRNWYVSFKRPSMATRWAW